MVSQVPNACRLSEFRQSRGNDRTPSEAADGSLQPGPLVSLGRMVGVFAELLADPIGLSCSRRAIENEVDRLAGIRPRPHPFANQHAFLDRRFAVVAGRDWRGLSAPEGLQGWFVEVEYSTWMLRLKLAPSCQERIVQLGIHPVSDLLWSGSTKGLENGFPVSVRRHSLDAVRKREEAKHVPELATAVAGCGRDPLGKGVVV